jgi:hypothetical protein
MPKVLVATVVLSLMTGPSTFANSYPTPSIDAAARLLRASPNGRFATLLRSTTSAMVERSATFSDILRGLGRAGDVLLLVKEASLKDQHVLGRTRFEVDANGVIIGHIEIDSFPDDPFLKRMATIAHELAHAYEVACLPRTRTTAELRRTLITRAQTWGRRGSTETPFARAAEAVIGSEFRFTRNGSQLKALSAQYGLEPCVIPHVDPPPI